MSPYHAYENISDEQLKEWHQKACLNKFNVFDDYNKVIVQLCRELIKERKNNDDK
mgnify:FL=1